MRLENLFNYISYICKIRTPLRCQILGIYILNEQKDVPDR